MYFVLKQSVIFFNGNVMATHIVCTTINDKQMITDRNLILDIIYGINDYTTMRDDNNEKEYVSWGMKGDKMYIGFYSKRWDEMKDEDYTEDYAELIGVIL